LAKITNYEALRTNYRGHRSYKVTPLASCGQCWEGAKPKNSKIYCNSYSGRNKENRKIA